MDLAGDIEFQSSVTTLARRTARSGRPTTAIPALKRIDPNQFGAVVATLDGGLSAWGDCDVPFSVQSLSKLFALCALLRLAPSSWGAVGWGVTPSEFNSLDTMEPFTGRPRNPFVNAGALLVTDRLEVLRSDSVSESRSLLHSANPNATWAVDEVVAQSEYESSHRNRAIVNVLSAHNLLYCDADRVLRAYVRQCAIQASCRDLALAALFLADTGGAYRVLSRRLRHQVNSALLTSGTYASSADVSFRIGLPTKSGIGGGILSIAPGRGAICAWSPPLDAHGNSAGGLAAVDLIASTLGWTVF